MDNELLKAISEILDEKLQPIKEDIGNLKSDVEGLKENMKILSNKVEVLEVKQNMTYEKLEILELKQVRTHEKLNNLSLDVKQAERNIRKDIHKLNDETETIIEVLQQNELIPR